MKILISASNMMHINNFHLPYIEALKEMGHQVYVMARGEGADFNIEFEKSTLSVKNFSLVKRIKAIIKEENFDIIFLHTSLCAFFVRLALKGIKERPRVVNTVHGYLFGKGFSPLHNAIYLLCEKITKKQTDHIVVMNDEDYEIATKNKLSLDGVSKINGIGIDFSKLARREIDKEEKTLVFVGELSKRKNQAYLIRAIKNLPEHRLILVGDGGERPRLEKLIKRNNLSGRVFITGYQADVSSYIQRASVYVSASKIEGLPFNVLEAMHFGKPILASRIKGHVDLLDNDSLFSLEKKDGLKIALSKCSEAERKYDVLKYSKEICLAQNMEIYQAQMEKTKKKPAYV